MKTLQMIHYFNFVIATVFVVFYFYQIGYLLLGLLMKHRKNKTGSSSDSPLRCGYFCKK